MTDTPEIEWDSPIESCRTMPTSILWPVPVDQRLEELLGRLNAVSAGDISRSKLLAAIVSASPTSGSELERLVKEYRALTAGDVVLQEDGPIIVSKRSPGRRRRT